MLMKFRNFLLLILTILALACGESRILTSLYQELNAPVEVTDLTEEVWRKLAVYRQNITRSPEEKDELKANQEIFYNRYIDADGIAIIGNNLTPDYHFVNARKAILIMTAKHPYLRKHFRGNFYFIITGGDGELEQWPGDGVWRFPYGQTIGVAPIFQHNSAWRFYGGTCGGFFCIGSTVAGLRHYSMRVVVHEFTHALDGYLSIYDPNFKDALQAAFENAIEKELWGLSNTTPDGQSRNLETNISVKIEWLAEVVEEWYFEIGSDPYARFKTVQEYIDYDPVTAELITKWFIHSPMQELFSADAVIGEMSQR